MGVMEKSLVDRCLKRALDGSGIPYTELRLADRCSLDISYHGPEARTSVRMKGVRGCGLKKSRRLIPAGPLGEIQYASSGQLHVEFPSVALLAALRGHSTAHHALAGYYTSATGPFFLEQMPVQLGTQFAQEHLSIEIDPEVVETLIQNNPPGPFGNSHTVIFYLLEVEQIARKRRWKSVDLSKWRSAGLNWPLLPHPRATPVSLKPMGRIFRVSERHAKLLRLFEQADEAGKARIEKAAAAAATLSMIA